MGDAHITTKVKGGGPSSSPAVPATLVAYTTIIDRKVQGIRVQGSYAWARFNSNDVVMAEEVFWPPVPINVLNEALALATKMADATAHASFVAQLPAALSAGAESIEVVIHHSPIAVNNVVTFASIDVSGRSLPEVHSFGGDGAELSSSPWWPTTTGTQAKP
jgi:hypothetical protein